MRRVIPLSVLALIVGVVTLGGWTLVTTPPASAGQTKVPVCHINNFFNFGGDGRDVPIGRVITIADPALPSHIEHGDLETFIETALPSGQVNTSDDPVLDSDGKLICVSDTDTDADGAPDYLDNCYINLGDGSQALRLRAGQGGPRSTPPSINSGDNVGALGNTEQFLLVFGEEVVDCAEDRGRGSGIYTTFLARSFEEPELVCDDIARGVGVVLPLGGYWTDLLQGQQPMDNALTDWWLCVISPTS